MDLSELQSSKELSGHFLVPNFRIDNSCKRRNIAEIREIADIIRIKIKIVRRSFSSGIRLLRGCACQKKQISF